MIKVMDLIDWIEEIVPYTYKVNQLPVDSPDECAAVRITPGAPLDRFVPIPRPDFQIVVRGSKQGDLEAEAVATSLLKELHQRSGGYISGFKLIQCAAEQSAPFYIGEDENVRPLYSINFTLTLL